jgi:hypothetical protein
VKGRSLRQNALSAGACSGLKHIPLAALKNPDDLGYSKDFFDPLFISLTWNIRSALLSFLYVKFVDNIGGFDVVQPEFTISIRTESAGFGPDRLVVCICFAKLL